MKVITRTYNIINYEIFEQQANEFQERHIGPNEQETHEMLTNHWSIIS